jgi:rhomboid protease GluP
MSYFPQTNQSDAPPPRGRIPRPILTSALVGVNVLVFAAMVSRTHSINSFTNDQVLAWGADWGPLTLGGQPWRALTSTYVHGGIVHIALNMWCLWNLGMLAEPIFGRLAFFLMYTACGIAGSILSLFLNPTIVSVGASGAVFGVAGALIAALYLGKLPVDRRALRPTLKSLVSFAGYNLIFGFVGNAAGVGIDNGAHIGGLVMGLAIGALLGQILVEPRPIRRRNEVLVFVATAAVLIAASFALQKTRGYVALLNRASDAIENHKLGKAASDLQQVIEHNPKNNMALVLLGNVYLQQKDYAKAEAVLKKAEANDPGNLGVQYNLGLLYEATDRFEQARVIFERLTREDAEDDSSWVLLGAALDGLGRESEAIHAYERAVGINPKNAEAHRELGLAHLKNKQIDAGIASLKASLDLDPKNAEAWRELGTAYVAANRPDEAAKAFQKFQELQDGAGKPATTD